MVYMEKIIKFEIGILLGTVLGAAVSTVVCSMCFGVLGYDATDILLIQDCLLKELENRLN